MYLRFSTELLINLSMKYFRLINCFLIVVFLSCQGAQSLTAEEVIDRSVESYGFHQNGYQINFDFRDYQYALKRKNNFYSYSRQRMQKQQLVRDIMSSEAKLKRYVNDSLVVLNDSIRHLYTNSLNSVLYFFQLPRPLKDPAVNFTDLGKVQIAGASYWVTKVTFDQEGGGDDFQDEYRYWINQNTYLIDYLAYNYLTDGGGTRFRKAVNRRRIDGFLIQDYENYKPVEKFPPLDQLPLLFQEGKLNLVSHIESKNIQVKPL